MKKIFYLAMLFAVPAMAQETVVFSTFEDTDVTFNDQGYWNGGKIGTPEEGDWGEEIYHCHTTSGLAVVNVDYNFMPDDGWGSYDWWSGVALSQRTGTTLTSMDDQYNNITGTGSSASKTFGVIYGNGATIDLQVPAEVKSLSVVNSAYTMQSVLVGDGYSPKFQNEGDHIYLNITGTSADGIDITKTVKLAEWTTELNYINIWTKIDLSSFGSDIVKLTFTFDAHNSGVPLYACIDNLELVVADNVLTGIDEANTTTTRTADGIYDLSGRRLDARRQGINIVRAEDGTMRKVFVK